LFDGFGTKRRGKKEEVQDVSEFRFRDNLADFAVGEIISLKDL